MGRLQTTALLEDREFRVGDTAMKTLGLGKGRDDVMPPHDDRGGQVEAVAKVVGVRCKLLIGEGLT